MGTSVPDLSQQATLTAEQQKQVIIPPQEWDWDFATKIATNDFRKMETFRRQNHDRRFITSDELLLAWKPRKTWENTKIPRASIPVFLALENIEALLPAALEVLISDNPPFDCQPMPGTTFAQAMAVKDLIRSQLRNLGDEGQFLTIREILRRCYRQALVYGNGLLEMGWLMRQINRIVYDRQAVARMATMPHPVTGEPIQMPLGPDQFDFVAVTREEKRSISKPQIDCTDIRDFYIDPDTPGPMVQQGKMCATHHWRTIAEILAFDGIPGFKIPPKDVLLDFANQKSASAGDIAKQQTESWRGNQYQPTQDYSDDPAQKKLALVRYWQRDRHVWVLGPNLPKQLAIYNSCNVMGTLPFLNSFYVDVPGRFYGLSLCDLVEGDQRLAGAILDARVDELNLIINAPFIRRRGAMQPNTMKAMRPGLIWEVEGNPKEEIIKMEMPNATAATFPEIQALELRVQKYTGVTDLAVAGVQTAGGNSANRTATGVSSQVQAANRRIGYQVGNIEDQTMEPMLYMLHALNKRYLNPLQLVELVSDEGKLIQLDPLTVMNADVRFDMQASAKMKTRYALQSGGLQMLLEVAMNPAFMQELAKTGITVDVQTLFALACDTLNVNQRNLIRPMTPQEMEMYSQPPIQEQIRMMMQRERLQSQEDNQDQQDDTKLILELIRRLVTPEAAHTLMKDLFNTDVTPMIKAGQPPARLGNGNSSNRPN